MKKKKLFLASLLSFSLTASMFFTTNIHALEEVQNENQIEESNETLTETPSLTLVSSTWDGENDIVFNVQAKDTKVELLENAINSKFEVVKFRLFDTQINGGLVECCDTLVNGVPYSDVNNAHKILAGLDIINTLIKFYKTSAPIFIDNRESINELYNINTQIISLIVTEDTELRIEVL